MYNRDDRRLELRVFPCDNFRFPLAHFFGSDPLFRVSIKMNERTNEDPQIKEDEMLHICECLFGLWHVANLGEISRQLQVLLIVHVDELQFHGNVARLVTCSVRITAQCRVPEIKIFVDVIIRLCKGLHYEVVQQGCMGHLSFNFAPPLLHSSVKKIC